MKKGDILLVKYKLDLIGYIIRKITKGNFNHTCIALSDRSIIDIRAKSIKIISYKKYLNKERFKCKLLRLEKLTDSEKYIIIDYILGQKKKYTYINWIISIILIALKRKPLRDTCSGLVAKAFYKIKYCFRTDKHPYQITPEDINKNKGVKDVTKDLYTNSSL